MCISYPINTSVWIVNRGFLHRYHSGLIPSWLPHDSRLLLFLVDLRLLKLLNLLQHIELLPCSFISVSESFLAADVSSGCLPTALRPHPVVFLLLLSLRLLQRVVVVAVHLLSRRVNHRMRSLLPQERVYLLYVPPCLRIAWVMLNNTCIQLISLEGTTLLDHT